jgi:hypothetical protein
MVGSFADTNGGNMNKIALLGALAVATLAACTDVQKAHYGTLGKSARVICFSGGKKIFDDFSTGQIANEEGSDGYKFVAKSDNRLVHVSGDCNLDYGATQPANFKPLHPGDVA